MNKLFEPWLTRLDSRLAKYTLVGRIRAIVTFAQWILAFFLVGTYSFSVVHMEQRNAAERLQNEAQLVQSHIAEWQHRTLVEASFIAEVSGLAQAITSGNKTLASEIVSDRIAALALNNVAVVDAERRFVVEFQEGNVSEFAGEDEVLGRALQGENVQVALLTSVEPRQYLLAAAVPLYDEYRNIVGAVLSGRLIGGWQLRALVFFKSDVHTALYYNGAFLFDDGRRRPAALQHSLEDREWVQQALTGGEPVYRLFSMLSITRPFASVYLPLDIGGDAQTVLALSIDMRPLIIYEWTMALIFTALLLGGSTILNRVVAGSIQRSVLRPLGILSKSVEAVAQGEYVQDVPVLSNDELGLLAQNFNRMSAAIRERDRQLREFNRSLEAQVAERTKEGRRMIAAVQAAANAVVITDVQAVIQWVNPAFTRLTGYTFEETIGRPISILKSGMQGEEFYRQMWTAIERGEVWKGEVINRRKDGSLYVEHMTITPVRDEQGKVYEYIAIKEDITERRRLLDELTSAREQAEAANQAKSQFLANMSHEFRTPLTAIIGYTELLEEDAHDLGYDGALPDLQKIRQAGEHLTALINAVLDLSKIEAGYMQLDVLTFPVNSVIKAVVATVEPLFIKKGNRFALDVQSELGEMSADPTKVRQILINLLNNANKFTQQGEVTLRFRRFEDENGKAWVEFQVQDTGIGISPEKLDSIFDEFVQVDVSVTREFGGTGLGLSVSKHFCEMMGGSIWAESEPGKGSTFTVRLPMVVEPSPET